MVIDADAETGAAAIAGRAVAVFSHPNHELAVFGLLGRLRPRMIFLTDGGGEDRVRQTRDGLSRIGLLEAAVFLNHSESSFYEALLRCDQAFWSAVADELRDWLRHWKAESVLCDAVELYNPVHDMSLPLAAAAVGGGSARLFEIPLIYERAGRTGYEVQRLPPSRRGEQLDVRLSPVELDRKLAARFEVYTILGAQLGELFDALPPDHAALEVFAPASVGKPVPNGEVYLRYERRARHLLDAGEISEMITYADHYRPVTSRLLDRAAA